MAAKKQVSGVTITVTNRDVWESFEAIGALVSRGWGDAKTALALGRTARSLRSKRDEIEDARKMLLKKFGDVDKSGEVKMDVNDRMTFGQEWEKLLRAEATLDIYPVSVTAVASREKLCETCHRGPLDDISALYLEALVHLGALTEDGA